jgi:hypothetical protein
LYVRGELNLNNLTAVCSAADGSDVFVLLEQSPSAFLGLAMSIEEAAGGGDDCVLATGVLCARCADGRSPHLNIHHTLDGELAALRRTSLRVAQLFEALGGPVDHVKERPPDAAKVFELASDVTMDLQHSYFVFMRKVFVDALSFALSKNDAALVFALVSTGRCSVKNFRKRYKKAYSAFFAVAPESRLFDGSLARVRTLGEGDVDVDFLDAVAKLRGFQKWRTQVWHSFARLGALCRRHAENHDRADVEPPEFLFSGLALLGSQPANTQSAVFHVLAGNADILRHVLTFAVDAHSSSSPSMRSTRDTLRALEN